MEIQNYSSAILVQMISNCWNLRKVIKVHRLRNAKQQESLIYSIKNMFRYFIAKAISNKLFCGLGKIRTKVTKNTCTFGHQ